MTAAAVGQFDRDTALEPLAEGLWRAVVKESWFIVTGPNGGFLAAVCTRAMTEATGRPARSLSLHYLGAPAAGPIEIACTVERVGGTTSFVSIRVAQDGVPMAVGVGACSVWREGQPEWADARPPVTTSPADARALAMDGPGLPAFWRNYEARSVSGSPGSGEIGPVVGWIRTAAPRPLDEVLVAALTDAWLPAAFSRLAERVIVPTIDLTIHWRAPFEGLGDHPWVLGSFVTRTGAGGVHEEDGELWSEAGALLAQSRQLAIVRRPR